MDTISDKLALVNINDLPYDPRTARVKEWLESRAAWGFCGHFEDAVENAEDDLRSFQRRLSTKQMRQDVFDVPVDIEDAIWKGREVVDDDKFGRLVQRGDPVQFLLNAWITPAPSEITNDPRTARVKEWLASHAATPFHFYFESALDDPDYDLKSILCNEHTRKTALRVPVDIEDAIWKGREVVDDDKFGRLVQRGDRVQFLLNAWITPAASEVERQERSK
ncbi:hypothetical protein C0991_005247 [Blastosporella zonata]|nr:hypothetical protein C0991_005247 [Blastosporella zonata]